MSIHNSHPPSLKSSSLASQLQHQYQSQPHRTCRPTTMLAFAAAAIGTFATVITCSSSSVPYPSTTDVAGTDLSTLSSLSFLSTSSSTTHIPRPPPPAPAVDQGPRIRPHAKRIASSPLVQLESISNGAPTTTVGVDGNTTALTQSSAVNPPSRTYFGFTTTSVSGSGVVTVPVTDPVATPLPTDADTPLGGEGVASGTTTTESSDTALWSTLLTVVSGGTVPSTGTSDTDTDTDTARWSTIPYTESVTPLPLASASTATT
ncbi:hypothetical protein F5Y05DRAFT_320482 [Hypoxylon sp. FL0543]|nr:hypothetical protein F5Y05DRAFT_320482 [Hypoxylon sp. FL0543]